MPRQNSQLYGGSQREERMLGGNRGKFFVEKLIRWSMKYPQDVLTDVLADSVNRVYTEIMGDISERFRGGTAIVLTVFN